MCTGLGHGEALVLLPSVADKFMPLSCPEDCVKSTSGGTLSLSFSYSARSFPHTVMMHLGHGMILVTRRFPCTVIASSPGNQSVMSVSMCSTAIATNRAADWMLLSETDLTLNPISFDPSRRSVNTTLNHNLLSNCKYVNSSEHWTNHKQIQASGKVVFKC